MAYHKATVSRGPVINRHVEALRRALPVGQYLFLLHQAATTGYVPTLDDNGKPIPVDEPEMVDTKTRLDTARYLLDKSMPDAKYDHEPPAVDATIDDVHDLTHRPSDELQRLFSESAVPDARTPVPVTGVSGV